MEVLLLKEAVYDLKTEKYTAIPGEVFNTLVDEPNNTPHPSERCIIFDSKKDYLDNAYRHPIDLTKSVYVNSKGQIICYLQQNIGTNVATDTKED